MSVRMVVRIQRARKRAGDGAKVNVREECGHRRVRGTVLSRRAEGRSCEKAHVKVKEEVGAQCCAVVHTRALCEKSALERRG